MNIAYRYFGFMALAAICFSLTIGGCSRQDYKYLSFEKADGVEVSRWTETGPDGVRLNRKIPLEYSIQRSDYTIKLILPDEQNGQAVLIAVLGGDPGTLSIKGNYVIELSHGPAKHRNSMYRYDFSPPIDARITELRFSVVDSGGNLYGTEVIPFEVMVGGSYISIDGI
ncbi:MAG: hypothetical protein Q8N51_17190 [Gammaproteobacteria bacterium]|nr:hypothetical protein [Gammaproteobacteria bacterium]